MSNYQELPTVYSSVHRVNTDQSELPVQLQGKNGNGHGIRSCFKNSLPKWTLRKNHIDLRMMCPSTTAASLGPNY